jgi:hypothetical protein
LLKDVVTDTSPIYVFILAQRSRNQTLIFSPNDSLQAIKISSSETMVVVFSNLLNHFISFRFISGKTRNVEAGFYGVSEEDETNFLVLSTFVATIQGLTEDNLLQPHTLISSTKAYLPGQFFHHFETFLHVNIILTHQ